MMQGIHVVFAGLCVSGSDLDYTPTRVSANPHEFLCQMFYKRL